VTTQSHAEGRVGTLAEIRDGMQRLGFHPLRWGGIGYEHATPWRIGRMCVWDVHLGNVVLSESGLPSPFDVFITPLPEGWTARHFHRTLPCDE
jgi:hypothetical protein